MLLSPKPVQAKLVGNTLVAAFRRSHPNLIWKFDLERNHSFTLALQGEEGDLELGVTTLKGEFFPVARFTAREDAEEAFTAVQKILMKRKLAWPKTAIKWIAVFLVLGLIALAASRYFGGHSYPAVSNASSGARQAVPAGVPLPADQVLRPP